MTLDLQPGASFSEYTLERRLGGGGFGDVWLSRDASGNPVALKVLHGQYQSDEAARLRAEIELLAAAASSRSNHIVRVLGGGSEPAPYVVMEYIDGTDLGREIARRGALPVAEVLRIGEGIADALATLQQAGIIHRDIKPPNVMIDSQGAVKLTDFGIAKIVGLDSITTTNNIAMSVAYAAPEAFEGKISYASDYYAFGALLYQCLTGNTLFSGTYIEIMRQHVVTSPNLAALPPEAPFSLRRLVAESLAKEPEERPANADILIEMLQEAQKELLELPSVTVMANIFVEPSRLGSWILESPAIGRDWTFNARHERNDSTCILEVHFADNLEYGELLKKAVDLNGGLVNLGAERLIGSSRFILRPREGWKNAPVSAFLFWVAREGPAAPAMQQAITMAQLGKATDALNELLAYATSHNLVLNFGDGNLRLLADGSIQLLRPALPPLASRDPYADATAFLESIPVLAQQDQTELVKIPSTMSSRDQSPMVGAATNTGLGDAPENPKAGISTIHDSPESTQPWRRRPLVFWGIAGLLISLIAVIVAIVISSSKASSKQVHVLITPAPAASPTPGASFYLAQGVSAYGAKNYDQAIAYFTQAIQLDPKDADEFYRRGLAYGSQLKYDLAVADYTKSLELSPKSVQAYIARGDSYRALKQRDQAWSDYSKAIDLDPKNSSPYYQRGLLSSEYSYDDGAISDFSRVIELSPRNYGAFINRGNAYKNKLQYDLALSDYNKSIELNQNIAESYNGRGGVYDHNSTYDLAITDYSKAIELKPDFALAYNNRGNSYRNQKNYDPAISDYNKAIELNPDYSSPYFGLGYIDYERSQYDAAITDYTKYLDLHPTFSGYFNRGLAYKIQKRSDLARQDFEKAKTLTTSSDELKQAQTQIDSLR